MDAEWEAGAYDSTQGHHAELLLRADLIQTIFADSGGWDLEARIATTFAPALSIEHRYLMSWGNDEDMGLGQIVIAPRLWLADTWTLSWFFGASYLHDANGTMGLGPQIGARLELFVWDPFFLDLSTRVHGLGEVVMPEHRISFGAFLGHAWAAELRVDHLSIMGGASLTTVGLGARMQMGL